MKSISKIGTVTTMIPVLFLLAGCNTDASRAKELRGEKSSGFITVKENAVDLGAIRMADGNVDIPFTFRNDGSESVVLLMGETSCMCTTAHVESNAGKSGRIAMRGHGPTASINQVLDPGEEAKLIATFDPNAHGPKATGPIMRDITITTNSVRTPTVLFRFGGNVVP